MRLTKVVLTLALSALALTRAHAAPHAGGFTSGQKVTRNKSAVNRPRTPRQRGLQADYKAAFFESVRAGDVRAVRRMLARGADSDALSECGAPAIVLAARAGSVELVRALLDAGAEVNAGDRNSYTPLHYAAQSGNFQLVSLLLARGADVNKPGYEDHTALMFAMQGAGWSRMPALLRKFLLREDGGETDDGIVPRYTGTVEGYRRVTARLIEVGADVNVVAGCGESALTFSAYDAELTKRLLAAGARVDLGWSPLCLIGDEMQKELSAAYLEDLTDVTNERERKPLALALRRWWAETATQRHEAERLLIKAGATRHGCGDEEDASEH